MMRETVNFSNIIAVTNRHLCNRPFMDQLRLICNYHPNAIILREKDLTEDDYTALLYEAKVICDQFHVHLIPHTFIQSAKKLGFHEIHLPFASFEDIFLPENEKLRTSFSSIGTSIHSVEDAIKAESLGASYITAGHIYTTDCKKGLKPRGLEFLKEVCQSVHIPVYGIGGINLDPDRLNEIMESGATGGCVMSGMMYLNELPDSV